jgi:hypothetical protein
VDGEPEQMRVGVAREVQTREHLFKNSQSWKAQQAALWANTSEDETLKASLQTGDAVRPYWTIWGRRVWDGRYQAAKWIGGTIESYWEGDSVDEQEMV